LRIPEETDRDFFQTYHPFDLSAVPRCVMNVRRMDGWMVKSGKAWYLKIRIKRIGVYRSESCEYADKRVAVPIEEILRSIDGRNSIAGKDVS